MPGPALCPAGELLLPLRLPPALLLFNHCANVRGFGVHPAEKHAALKNVTKFGQLKQALASACCTVDDALKPSFAPPCDRKARHVISYL